MLPGMNVSARPRTNWRGIYGAVLVMLAAACAPPTDASNPGGELAQGESGGAKPVVVDPMPAGTVHRFLALQLNKSPAGGIEINATTHEDGRYEVQERFLLVMIRENTGYVDRFETETQTQSEYDATGRLTKDVTKTIEAGVTTTKTIEIQGKNLRFVLEGPSRNEDVTYPLPEDYRSGRQVFAELKKRIDAGERDVSAKYPSFDSDDRTFHTNLMTVHETLEVDTPQGKKKAYRITERDETEGQEIKALVDEQDLAIEIDLFGVFLASWVEKSPFEGELGGRITSEIAVTGKLTPRWRELTEVKLDLTVTGDADEPIPLLETSGYHTVEREGDTYHVTLHAQLYDDLLRQGKVNPDKLLAIPPDIAPFLGATALSQSDHVAIISQSKEITSSSNAAIENARKVVGWVFYGLKKEGGARGNATAVEVLENRAGDCTEHAALAVALLRAAGLPARNADGIVILEDGGKAMAGYHAWSEVWIGGWLPIDAMFFETGTTARYLHFGYNEPGMPGGGGKIGRTIGKTSIKIISSVP